MGEVIDWTLFVLSFGGLVTSVWLYRRALSMERPDAHMWVNSMMFGAILSLLTVRRAADVESTTLSFAIQLSAAVLLLIQMRRTWHQIKAQLAGPLNGVGPDRSLP